MEKSNLRMTTSIIFATLLIFVVFCNKTSTKIIIKYYRKKAPGHQSLIDYFFIDFLNFYSLTTLIFICILCTGRENFELINQYENVAYILSAITEILNLITLCKLLTFLCLKYLSIYLMSTLNELEEEKLNNILTRIQIVSSTILIILEYFAKFYEKNEFMVYNVLTNGSGSGGMPALVQIPIIMLCVVMALVLQIRIEIDNYHYGDNAGCFLKMVQTFKNQENEGKYLQKCGFLTIILIIFVLIIFFAFLPSIEMSNLRVVIVVIVFICLFVCPPILFILTHQKIKDFALKLFRQKLSDVAENLTNFTDLNSVNRSRIHSLVV